MTWNGTNITGPVLIYQDELVVDDRASPTATPTRNGTLMCTSQDQHRVGWHDPKGSSIFENSTSDFRQIRTDSGVTPSVSILSANTEDVSINITATNGLWICRLNESSSVPTPIPVGIYGRGGSECKPKVYALLCITRVSETHDTTC